MNWSVDYGDGPVPCEVPHAWRQDVPLTWEGPAIYRTTAKFGPGRHWLVFHGASYHTEVFVAPGSAGPGSAGILAGIKKSSPSHIHKSTPRDLAIPHTGLWDAFAADLGEGPAERAIEVRCVKNGGATHPVNECISGFLPYVFGTFGGLWGGVELVASDTDPTAPCEANPCRVAMDGHRLLVNGEPTHLRAALHWGWYPEVGHPNPPDETVHQEARMMKAWGFNCVKCCLWVPQRRWIEIMAEHGLLTWLELPLWAPTNYDRQELERIVLLRRDLTTVVAWTLGCELGAALSAEERRELVESVRALTGAALVKDSSGGAEMYGGDQREFGTFEDFHPYCDLPYYPPVIESLMSGPRPAKPLLLGEFCDHDAYREPAALEGRFWASSENELNDKGVRWQYDLVNAPQSEPRPDLRERSLRMARYVRRRTMEAVRARPEIAGWVITGWRDTPISTSGFVDDDLQPVHPLEPFDWNAPDFAYLIPQRRPPWVHGGNRPGWGDPQCRFAGPQIARIGISTEGGVAGEYNWSVAECGGSVAVELGAGETAQIAELAFDLPEPGEYALAFGPWTWRLLAVAPFDRQEFKNWRVHDPLSLLFGLELGDGPNLITTEPTDRCEGKTVLIQSGGTCLDAPGWRECVLDGDAPFVDDLEWYFGISPESALDPAHLRDGYEEIVTRLDTRTYRRLPLLVCAGDAIITSLRPQGGLGAQPFGVEHNPGGLELLRYLCSAALQP